MLTADAIAEFETTHKRIAHVIGKDNAWECVFRKPTRAEYKRFRSMASNPSQQADAQEVLARSCVVYPTPVDFDALLEEYPAIAEACGGALGKLVGLAVDDSVK